jgi:hypothetical protein
MYTNIRFLSFYSGGRTQAGNVREYSDEEELRLTGRRELEMEKTA